ncbi:MAG: hypothetical protein Q7J85_12350 [Bacillota bacterium]|nr:hypothetical protein [Bacillota bacterium]
MKIEFDVSGQGIVVNGVKFLPETVTTFKYGEVVIIKEVTAQYGIVHNRLCLCFEMPKMKLNPGDKIRIIKE